MIKRVALLAIIMILGLSSPVFSAEMGEGMIEGQVLNRTDGGSSVAGQTVILNVYLGEDKVDEASTGTDADGKFTFSGLSTMPGYMYETVITYQGVAYYGEPFTFDESEIIKSVEIIVFDSTTSDEAIYITMSHVIIYAEDPGLLIKEYYLIFHDTDRTYIGPTGKENSAVLQFSLPQGATALMPTVGIEDLSITSRTYGFDDTTPVYPGMKEVSYSYRLLPDSGTYTLSKAIYYPMSRFDLLVPNGEFKVTSNQLTQNEPMDISGATYDHLSGQEITPGDTLEIKVSGLGSTDSQGSLIWVFTGLLAAVVGFIFVFFIRRKKSVPENNEASFEQRKQLLLAELAALDDDFEAGNISETSYNELRDEKKAELIAHIHKSEEE
ncbi:hypothetical protein ACFLWU_03620 [Chloroflexota bacterium]